MGKYIMKRHATRLVSLLSLFVLTGCGYTYIPDVVENKEFITKEFLDFTKEEPNSQVFGASDGYGNGDPFGCDWSKDNVSFDEENGMNLYVSKNGDTYYGGEMKTLTPDGLFSGGYFSTVMKPSNVTGTASTFFLYTGDPHDEVDIEFLGKDTTKVQFNYFVNGQGGHEYWYDLGFDASEDYHSYGFYWDISKIIWYVDDKPVYEVMGDVPSHMMRMYTNFWIGNKSNPGIMGWMGNTKDEDLPAICSYKKINFADMDGNPREVPSKDPKDEFNPDYVVSMYELGFSSNAHHTVTKKTDSYEVTFTQEEGMYHYIAPDGYAQLKFGEPKYAEIKVKNLSDFAYDFCISYYNSTNEYVGLDGIVTSENGTSYLRKKGSTCLYYYFGAGDTATFKSTLADGITKFSKMNIFCAPNSNTTGSFAIYDWYVYDVDPQDNKTPEEVSTISLMDKSYYGNYQVETVDGVHNVTFSQSPNAFKDLKVENPQDIEIHEPKYSVIKVKNTSNYAYDFTLTFRDVSNSYMTTGGVVLESVDSTTTYAKHGSTAEYFNLGVGDTATLKVFINEAATSFKLIEIIVEPKIQTEITGTFQILDWYIAQAA